VTVHGTARALLAVSLVVGAAAGAAAEEALTPFLKPLNLVAYSSRVVPPELVGETADGRVFSITALRGQVVLVNFFATWCAECRPEMPVLERLHRELGRRGLSVVGVDAHESASVVQRYGRELGVTFPLVLDATGKINTLYGVVGIPTTFVVGRDGRAVAFGVGAREWGGAPARALIEALLAEPGARPATP
jgi:thiol-disulfide isomerase/thioredoxin